jgi:protein required for attachment to host cells
MPVTWVLVADRGGARLFTHRGRSKGLQRLEEIPHPEGRLKNGELNADKHGRSFDSTGNGRHAMSTSESPTEHLAARFARELAHRLDQGSQQQRYERLVLVAAPRFLGMLRGAMGATAKSTVMATVNKDLSGVQDRDLPEYLSGLLPL